jgi:CHAT domain-containing protein
LPETAIEVASVATALGARRTDIFLGNAATETAIKKLSREGRLQTYRILHFATHGLVAGEAKGLAEPALALTAPINQTEEDDGLLTASEVSTLKLNADMVLLSACNTAAGDKAGAEALSGLAQAFFYAGARSLLVSHWYVNSQAAVEITIGLFSELKRSPDIGRAEALRRSMLALMSKGGGHAHPGTWAPFVVVGEGASR